MAQPIMVGCDLHEKSMTLCVAQGKQAAKLRTIENTPDARANLIAELRQQARKAKAKVVFAYEASSLGFGLHDELDAAGIRCWVLAPTKIERSSQEQRRKTDDRDANKILELLRGHLLAGNKLPTAWVPSQQLRDDRDLVRARLDIGVKISRLKAQVRTLLKRNEQRPPQPAKSWNRTFRDWLRGLCSADSPLGTGGREALASLLRQLHQLQEEEAHLDQRVRELAERNRYRPAVYNLTELCGVSVLSAMVFLVEIGDPRRFRNRRQIGAYLGLVPSSHESGDQNDRKGHITHQGPARVRRVLCQATWARVKHDAPTQKFYQRLSAKNPKRKKIAVVAAMRRLGVLMWHRACDAESPSGPEPEFFSSGSPEGPPLPPSPPRRTRRGATFDATATPEGARETAA